MEIELDSGAGRHFFWMLVRLVLAGVLILRMGTAFGWVAGGLLAAFGVRSAILFVRSAIRQAAVVTVVGNRLLLPRTPTSTRIDAVPLRDVRHCYLLKRAVPWTMSGPVVVVETASQVWNLPRDWFKQDDDPHRLVAAVAAARPPA